MNKIVTLCLAALIIAGIASISFTFYRTIIQNRYSVIDAATN
jgi:hypothetical protein